MTEAEFQIVAGRIEAISAAPWGEAPDLEFGLADYGDMALDRLRSVIDRLARYCSLETRIESVPFACTIAGWNGNLVTVYSPKFADAGQQSAHLAALAEALMARARIVRILSASVGAVAAISTSAVSPFGAVNALRAVAQLAQELESVLAPPG